MKGFWPLYSEAQKKTFELKDGILIAGVRAAGCAVGFEAAL